MLPIKFKFNPGDKVVYTNEYGVCFGVKTITEQVVYETVHSGNQPRYHIDKTDTPWLPKEEARFTLADKEDLLYDEWHGFGGAEHLQEKHGFPATDEQCAALLDNDPFEGEL